MAVNDFKPSKQFLFYLNTCFLSIPVHLYSFGVKKKKKNTLAHFEDERAHLATL